jgi:hypothetical protein
VELEQILYKKLLLNEIKDQIKLPVSTSLLYLENQSIKGCYRGEQALDPLLFNTKIGSAYIVSEKPRKVRWAYIDDQFGFSGYYNFEVLFTSIFYEQSMRDNPYKMDDFVKLNFNTIITSWFKKGINHFNIKSNHEVMSNEYQFKLPQYVLDNSKMYFLIEYGIVLKDLIIINIADDKSSNDNNTSKIGDEITMDNHMWL